MFKKNKEYIHRPKTKYSDHDLEDFHKEMQKYRIEKKHRDGSVLRFYDERKFLVEAGALNNDGEVILKNIVYGEHGSIKDAVCLFKDLQDKIDQWSLWLSRQDWVKKKIASDFDKVAASMKISHD